MFQRKMHLLGRFKNKSEAIKARKAINILEGIGRNRDNMELIDKFAKSFNELKNELNENANSRYLSWEYCYEKFYKAFNNLSKLTENDYLKLSLHLAFYLASWGMYRGSSFLLQFDYKIHLKTVKLILDKTDKYKSLLGYCWEKNDQKYSSNLDLVFGNTKNEGLINQLKKIYKDFRKKIKNKDETKQDISDILVTKILLGTLGCVPAYDEMLKRALKFGKNECGENNLIQKFSKKSFEALVDFYSENAKKLNELSNNLKLKEESSIKYPQMKILDMGLWKLGLNILLKEEIDNKIRKFLESGKQMPKNAEELIKLGLPSSSTILQFYKDWKEPFLSFENCLTKTNKK